MQSHPAESATVPAPAESLEQQKIILEQYKVYVEMHDRISARRTQMNCFYVSLLSGLLALFSIATDQRMLQSSGLKFAWLGVGVGLLGTILCVLWHFNIHAYAVLVARKVKIIIEMEQHLPFQCYAKEGLLRAKALEQKSYLRMTEIEKLAALAFGAVYGVLLIFALVQAFKP